MIFYLTSSRRFLDASSHLYKRVCPSVRRSVRPSVRRSVGPSGMLSLTRCESHLIAGIGTCWQKRWLKWSKQRNSLDQIANFLLIFFHLTKLPEQPCLGTKGVFLHVHFATTITPELDSPNHEKSIGTKNCLSAAIFSVKTFSPISCFVSIFLPALNWTSFHLLSQVSKGPLLFHSN